MPPAFDRIKLVLRPENSNQSSSLPTFVISFELCGNPENKNRLILYENFANVKRSFLPYAI